MFTVLMILGAAVALVFAARSAGEIVQALARPITTATSSSTAESPTEASVSSRPVQRQEAALKRIVIERTVRDISRQAQDYLKRIATVDVNKAEATRELAQALLRELRGQGLIRSLRLLRRNTNVEKASELRQIEAVFLRAAAAADDRREWASIQKLVRKYDLVRVCSRL